MGFPLAIWVCVILCIRLLSLLQNISFIHQNLATFTAILLLYPPVIVGLKKKQPITYWRVSWQSLLCDVKVWLCICFVVFPAAFVVNHYYQKIIFGAGFHSGQSDLWPLYIITQLVLVAFPEEFFFRGYLQEQLNAFWPAKNKVFGAAFGVACVVSAFVFALSHSLISLQWWHGFIFFPALLFAWLKQKTGTIWAATFFHAACNVFSYWVALHY